MKESSSQQQQQQPSSLAPMMAGMGLFLATAAVSQWIQLHHKSMQQKQQQQEQNGRRRNRRRRRLGSRSTSADEDWYSCNNTTSADEGEPYNNNYLSKEAFRRRRLARRMSFEQVDEGTVTPQKQYQSSSLTQDNQSQPQSPATEWSIHRATSDLLSPEGRQSITTTMRHQNLSAEVLEQRKQGRNTRRAPPPQLTNPNAAPLNQRYHDFHPKYQNWRHFEHFNEHDRAKQRRKAQLLRNEQQQQQQQQQQYSSSQQDAGEGASQNEKEKSRRQNLPKEPTIDNGSDDESLSTFNDESEVPDENENENNSNSRNDDSLSVASFGSGNQFVWTGGPESKRHYDESFELARSLGSTRNGGIQGESKKSDVGFRQQHDSKGALAQNFFGPHVHARNDSLNRLAIRSGTTGVLQTTSSGSSSSSRIDKNHHKNHRMGKFERFYRMLTSSFIDDDSEHVIDGNCADGNRISLSSNSTNFGGSSTSFDYDGDVEDRHRALRTEYNAQIMPEKLVLIRHGQSMGNVDERYYATHPDNAIPITDLGWEQARKAGTILKDKIITPGESVHFIVSPYVRTVETFHGIVSAWCDPESEEFANIQDRNRKVSAWYERLTEMGLTWNEDSRIREQDFGNYQNPEQTRRAKEERHRFGAFYYRFHNGESGSDVFDRVSTFLDSLWRSFETNKSQNYVLVTHGIVLRVLMARYFRYTITQLNTLANPRNCEMVVLGHEGNGRLDLEGRCSLELEEDPETNRTVVKGYKFHKRLRILPKSNIRTVRFRISPMDDGKV